MSDGGCPLERFLTRWVAAGEVSAVVGVVATADAVLWSGASGFVEGIDLGDGATPVNLDTRFDLASLTKPFVASLALVLDGQGDLPLSTPLGEIFPGAHPRLARTPLSLLLRHRSGLRAWTPLYARCRSPQDVLPLLVGGDLLGARAGTYSDLGYILWGLAAEAALGLSLVRLLRRHLLLPLGADEVAPSPAMAAAATDDVAECHLSNGREVELAAEQGIAVAESTAPPLRGTVQDGNARFLGGSAGHAGLFACVRGLVALGRQWLKPDAVLSRAAVLQALSGPGPYALGWARRTLRGSAGPGLSRRAFGHTGFTGGSLWIDPETGWILVLLAHRLSPFSDPNRGRRRFHRLVRSCLNTKNLDHD